MRKDFVKKGTMRTVLVLLLLVAGLCCAGAVAAAGQNGLMVDSWITGAGQHEVGTL